jgi:hypothetical protein
MSKNEALGAVIDQLTGVFENKQFSRIRKNVWASRTDELTRIINLERSPLGQLYFLNFGISINELHKHTLTTNVAASDVYSRISGLIPHTPPNMAQLEYTNGDFRHFDRHLLFLKEKAFPILSSIRTVKDLRAFLKECQPANYLVRLDAVNYLKRRS